MGDNKCYASSCSENTANAPLIACFGDCGLHIHPTCAGRSRKPANDFLVFCCEECRQLKDNIVITRELSRYVMSSYKHIKELKAAVDKLAETQKTNVHSWSEFQESILESNKNRSNELANFKKDVLAQLNTFSTDLGSFKPCPPSLMRSDIKSIVLECLRTKETTHPHDCLTEATISNIVKNHIENFHASVSAP